MWLHPLHRKKIKVPHKEELDAGEDAVRFSEEQVSLPFHPLYLAVLLLK